MATILAMTAEKVAELVNEKISKQCPHVDKSC